MRKLALTTLYLAVVALTACGQGTAGGPNDSAAPHVNYRAMLRAWFDSHKRYPLSACQRGEEGSVKMRFQVDRLGRVVDHTLLTSSGYADLDQSSIR
jgi:outer membrane biosynthesis protein TonB